MIKKKEFIEKMAKKGGIKKAYAKKMCDLFIETLLDCLKECNGVKLRDFGKFEVKTAREKNARNPKTGEKCIVPERKRIRFYPSENLASKVEKDN